MLGHTGSVIVSMDVPSISILLIKLTIYSLIYFIKYKNFEFVFDGFFIISLYIFFFNLFYKFYFLCFTISSYFSSLAFVLSSFVHMHIRAYVQNSYHSFIVFD